jgi:hypothetical protein
LNAISAYFFIGPRQRTRRGPPKRLTNVQVDYINKIMKELMVRDEREKKQLGDVGSQPLSKKMTICFVLYFSI